MMLLMAVNAFANTTDNLKEIDSTIREAAYKIRHITAFEGIAYKYMWEVSEDSWEIGDTTLGADHPVSGYDANAYYIIKDFKNKNEIYAFFEEAFTEEYSKKIVDNFGLPGNMELFKQHTDGNVYICNFFVNFLGRKHAAAMPACSCRRFFDFKLRRIFVNCI